MTRMAYDSPDWTRSRRRRRQTRTFCLEPLKSMWITSAAGWKISAFWLRGWSRTKTLMPCGSRSCLRSIKCRLINSWIRRVWLLMRRRCISTANFSRTAMRGSRRLQRLNSRSYRSRPRSTCIRCIDLISSTSRWRWGSSDTLKRCSLYSDLTSQLRSSSFGDEGSLIS